MNCLAKLSAKLSTNSLNAMKSMIDLETVSIHPEVQQRANEYLVFFGLKNHNLKSVIMGFIPNHKNVKETENTVKK
jgi:hypothetical protein